MDTPLISTVQAINLLNEGKLIAYPTEAVYGLGCDPFNQTAVMKLLALKQRSDKKGLIVLISDYNQLTQLIGEVSDSWLKTVEATWPGPVTWIFPHSNALPSWLTGEHEGIAIRMSAHPVARQLCANGPVISTSANISGLNPARNCSELQEQFPDGIDAIVEGELGNQEKPSSIFDVCTGHRLR